jgi:cell division septation protein DedD
MVMGKMTQTEIIKTAGLDNIHVITSGPIPPNPAELIGSSALGDFIEEAKEEYDMILFDSSPILSTADAAILGRKVDGVLLVYRVGSVSRGMLKRSTALLKQVECNIMGVILNGMRPEVSPDFQDYKYYSSSYSYGEEGKGKNSREHKRGFAFFRGKGDRPEEEKAFQEKSPKKLKIGRLVLMLVAIAFLSAGILWQSGIIDPFKALDIQRLAKKGGLLPGSVMDTEAPKVKKGISKPAIPGKPETVSQKPKPTVSVGKPAVKGKISVQKGTSETSIRKKSEAVSAKQKSAEKIVSYPYSIRLGAFSTPGGAKKAVSLYRKKELSPYWVEVELGNKTWYRVYAGHFEGPEQAEKFRKEHRLREALVRKTKYANLIDTYTSPDELEDKILSLKNLGLSPYVIKDHTGQSRLFVGTFVTKEGAEKQYHDLKVRGIQSQVVER